MSLREIITAKTSGFCTKKIYVREWGTEVTVREPMHIHLLQFSKSIKNIDENNELNDEEKIRGSIEAEATLFASILLDENGDTVFDNDISDLLNSYGAVHSRVLNESLALMNLDKNPIETAEKK